MWILYGLFLVGYAGVKVMAVPEAAAALDPGYLRSTATVTVMTGVAPFMVAWLLVRGRPLTVARMALGVLVAMTLCVVGYAGFWYFFIPADPAIRPPLAAVAQRGLLPGLVMGAILMTHRPVQR